ncbi:MAG: ATP-binding protein [Candidatus Pacebacteria bacterium]|nr:ATP-binding protein [Candidatus Paceibacterota bacterium]
MQIQLIEFSAENYGIFKKKATFSMLARKNDKHTFESGGEYLLKTSLIYGPNASGKSSLLEAFRLMRAGILNSANIGESPGLPYKPFLGDTIAPTAPTFFELVFSAIGNYPGVYRYSFSFYSDHIVSEALVKILPSGSEEICILRNEQEFQTGGVFSNEHLLTKRTRKEALFLSTAAVNNSEFALNVVEALRNVNIISAVTHKRYQEFTIRKFKESPDFKKKVLQYLKIADFCITDGLTEEIDVQTIDIKDDADGFSANKRVEKGNVLLLKHPIFSEDNSKIDDFTIPLNLESTGTQKFLSILGPIVDTLTNGKILFVDEFDNSLHPLLTKFIIDLFESSETNTKNAQLIVTTHDTSLLSYKDGFIRDQFWFTEKNEFGGARLFSLAEFVELRNDTEFSKKYLEGRFGALPFIESVEN